MISKPESLSKDSAIRVILANLSLTSRNLLCSVLQDVSGICVVGYTADLDHLSDLLNCLSPHVALVGADGPRGIGRTLAFLRHIRSVRPPIAQVVISDRFSQDDVVSCFRNGARGLLKDCDTDSAALLAKCICCVSAGQVWADTSQLDHVLRSFVSPVPSRVITASGRSVLSCREDQVLGLLAGGLSNRELAMALQISEHTVKNHLFRIFDKLGVSNRLEAVLYAMNHRGQSSLSSGGMLKWSAQVTHEHVDR